MIVSFSKRLLSWIDYRIARLRAPKTSRKRIKNINPKNILILCYGNIYRSPFVEFYLNNKIENNLITIKSAGFHQVIGRKSSDSHIERCRKWAVDLSPHRSKLVDHSQVNWADLIVIMDGLNYKLINMLDRKSRSKLVWLGALADEERVEILDPYDKPSIVQENIVKQLVKACDQLIRMLK